MAYINIQNHKNQMDLFGCALAGKGADLNDRAFAVSYAVGSLAVAVASMAEQLIRDLAHYLPALIGACQKGEVKSIAEAKEFLGRLGPRPDHTSSPTMRLSGGLGDCTVGAISYVFGAVRTFNAKLQDQPIMTDWEAGIDLASRSLVVIRDAVVG